MGQLSRVVLAKDQPELQYGIYRYFQIARVIGVRVWRSASIRASIRATSSGVVAAIAASHSASAAAASKDSYSAQGSTANAGAPLIVRIVG